MMIDQTLRSIQITLYAINICLHLLGCCLLQGVYNNGRQTVQQLYLINLSLNEAIKNIIFILLPILNIVSYSNISEKTAYNVRVSRTYIYIIGLTGFYWSYVLAMFYVTCDRLLHVLFCYRYPMFWTISTARKLLIVTCFVNCAISLIFALIYYFILSNTQRTTLKNSLQIYIPTVLYSTFLVFALVTYIVMFFKFVQSRRLTMPRDTDAPQETLFHIFVNSRFFISVMLISSYIILAVIPIVIRSLYAINNLPTYLHIYTIISITLSDTADAVIYIFMDRQVRKFLWQNVSMFTCKRSHVFVSNPNENVILSNANSNTQTAVSNIHSNQSTTEL